MAYMDVIYFMKAMAKSFLLVRAGGGLGSVNDKVEGFSLKLAFDALWDDMGYMMSCIHI